MHAIRTLAVSLGVLLAIAVAVAPAGAQPSAAGEAETVVRRAFDHHAAARYDSVAALVHPDALTRFRQAQLDMARAMERQQDEEARRYPPDMPEAVIEWFELQQRRTEDTFGGWFELATGVKSLAELEALSAAETLARSLQANDPRERARALRARNPHLPDEATGWFSNLERRTVIGTAAQDDTTAYVVYRTELGSPARETVHEQLAVATLRRTTAGWRMWAPWPDEQLFGSGGFAFSLTTVDDGEAPSCELDPLPDAPFEWTGAAGAAVRARLAGTPDEGGRPDTLRLELDGLPAGAAQVELPFEAVARLVDYLRPWLRMPER